MRWWLGAISNLPKHILPFPGCPPIPPPWCLRSKSCLSLPFTRSLQLCGFILNTPGLFEYLPSHLPLPASSARLPSAALSAPLSADSSVHFTARDDLRVIPKRKGEREGSELTFWPTWLGLNQTCLAPFNLSFCAYIPLQTLGPAHAAELRRALHCDWSRDFSGPVRAMFICDGLAPSFPRDVFLKKCGILNSSSLSPPSYFNLYLRNWFALSESIPFLINQLSADLWWAAGQTQQYFLL